MSLLDGIRAGRQLRKVGIQHDASAPSLVDSVKLTDEYDALVLQANIENWGSALAAFTPRTILVPITLAQGSLLLRAYEKLEHSDAVDAAAAEYLFSGKISSPLIPEEAALLEELGAQIQRGIDGLVDNDEVPGCFMKLSSRSPKDAAARSGVFEAYYARAVRDDSGKLRELDEQEKLRILCESEGAALRFKDAASVIRALVLSERVWQDMTLALRHPDTWKQNVILRKWEPVPIDMEFRTFVANGRMTALSQYAYQLYSSRLNNTAQLRLAITAIQNLYHDLWPILSNAKFSNCVLDFGVVPPTERDGSWRAILIEINPFEETTDGALFSWTRERAIIEGKAEDVDYPVVRITEAKRTGALAMIPKGWKEVMVKVEGTQS
ncbi:cell division cycle protein 123-like protein [Mycena sanguinolenta]|uniref:Cell division cycle protein 123-like protein n=1 Tax=Mycena sanguinolenta TaxID=230812 RepID=A0A8H7CPW0_9AGAR|nr:cell division cycle protein 123-like protein [Mycena sanguinolenta]